MESIALNLQHDREVANQRDISGRKYTESELLRFEAIVESSNDAIVGIDLQGIVTSWNPAARRIFGYDAKQIIGRNFHTLIPLDREREYTEIATAAFRGKGTNDFETILAARDGRRIDVSITLSPIRGQGQCIIGISAIVRDTTERRLLEKEILEVADFEKQRLGHDLHDDLCQLLVGISLIGSVLHEELVRLEMKQAVDARQLIELARTAVDSARSLAKGLSPLNLLNDGFMAALENLVADTGRVFRVPCLFECKTPVPMENASVANHLYRITQEALHNAVKHSHASKVGVILESTDEFLVITVRDDGVGIEESAPTGQRGENRRSGGLGMHTMQYRARIIRATLEFRRNPDAGTSVICRLPNDRR